MYFLSVYFSQFPFNKEQVRVLLFRECDWRGRRLLFDSSAIEPINGAQTTPLQTPTPQHINLSVNGKSAIKHDKVHIEYCDGVPYKVTLERKANKFCVI